MGVVLLALWCVYFAAIGLISLRLVTYVSLLLHIHHGLQVTSDRPNIEPVHGCRVCGDKKRHSPLSWKLLARYRFIGIPSQDFGISAPADGVDNVWLGRFYVCGNCIWSMNVIC